MKRFIRKVQTFGNKAAELREALEKVPGKVAELRQSVNMTTDQLKLARAEVLNTIEDLQAHNEDRLLTAIQEINAGGPVLREAGFELNGLDMDFSTHQRLIVHLEKVGEVRGNTLRSLIKTYERHKTLHALLSSILRAEELANRVELADLEYRRLTVHIGPIPGVRIGWRAEEVFEEMDDTRGRSEPPPPLPSATPTLSRPVIAAASGTESSQLFGKDSFFGRREPESAAPGPEEAGAHPAEAPSAALLPTPTRQATREDHASDWKQEALERFKKMPTTSKYRR